MVVLLSHAVPQGGGGVVEGYCYLGTDMCHGIPVSDKYVLVYTRSLLFCLLEVKVSVKTLLFSLALEISLKLNNLNSCKAP